MASEVKLPRLGQGMEAGTIVKWLKAEGDSVQKGEPLYELDTDKVTQEVEAEASGVLLKIAVASGEVPVGQTVAVIGEAGEQVTIAVPSDAVCSRSRSAAAAGRGCSQPRRLRPRPRSRTAAGSRHRRSRDGWLASAGSSSATSARHRPGRPDRRRGRRGRTGARPPRRWPRPSRPARSSRCPLTSVRKTIARRLTAAWTVPVFELTVSADMTRANALVQRVRELDPDVRVTVTDLLVKVCAQALARHPDVNVQFTDEALLRFPTANVGIAVAAPQGLVVPVIRSAERLSLAEITQARTDVVGRARDHKLQQADLEEGTFTISNLGMFAVEQFVAVLNPPQAAILAVGTTEDRAVVRDGRGRRSPDDDGDADRRPSRRRRGAGRRVPPDGEVAARGSRARAVSAAR